MSSRRATRPLWAILLLVAAVCCMQHLALAQSEETTDTSALTPAINVVASEIQKLRGPGPQVRVDTFPPRTIRAEAFSATFPIKSATVRRSPHLRLRAPVSALYVRPRLRLR